MLEYLALPLGTAVASMTLLFTLWRALLSLIDRRAQPPERREEAGLNQGELESLLSSLPANLRPSSKEIAAAIVDGFKDPDRDTRTWMWKNRFEIYRARLHAVVAWIISLIPVRRA